MKTSVNLIKITKSAIVLVTSGLMLASVAYADAPASNSKNTAQKVATITQMYDQDIQNEGLGESVLNTYASPALKAAFKREQDYFDREEMICGTGFDVLWESQDPDYSQDKTIVVRGDMVAVTLAHGGTVQYKMACAKDCVIEDVIMDNGKSLKDHLNASCQ